MTTKQADQLITSTQEVTVKSREYDNVFQASFVSRDRFNITAADGGLYDRADLEVIQS